MYETSEILVDELPSLMFVAIGDEYEMNSKILSTLLHYKLRNSSLKMNMRIAKKVGVVEDVEEALNKSILSLKWTRRSRFATDKITYDIDLSGNKSIWRKLGTNSRAMELS